jgi:hypothetical protein
VSANAPASSSSAARFASDGSAPRPLLFGIDVTLSGQAVIRRLARELPDEAADLMEIAASIHASDWLAPPAA